MPAIRRRTMLAGLAAAALPVSAGAQGVQDAAGRPLPVPARVGRVFPAGPPASILLYTLAPELLAGWPRAPSAEERAFLLPEIAARPELGRLTGRGNTANLEAVLQAKPDLILDVGTIDNTYVSLADRVQSQTGIPYALLDGRLDKAAETYRMLGRLLRQEPRGEALAGMVGAMVRTVRARVASVPEARRPRVYYARGPRGLETGLGGSINVETMELMGARNVAGAQRGGLATVSLEQVLGWDPEVIVTIDRDFARTVRSDLGWAAVSAVRAGRVHLAPALPFGWIDFPPSVNRLIGLTWVGKALHPELFPEDMRQATRDFYQRFYHVAPSDAQLEQVLAVRA